ncbi:MAG: LacI family DNA-binding transcriptional regulator [Hyphomicrobiales bacterium]|nr:LacI family DNA-binding transcriptional regulator [Alphaproteobacteria bacterium]MCP4998474.1 LacI family DNA-binding transcriptional regulator [Hyphomicrobiales bacterium]
MNLKELSEHLGLSQTTVSRALNGFPEVKESTRLRVLEAAKKHNYSPNLRAKNLATGRAMATGHVIPLSSKHEMVNPIFGDFIAGAGEVYARNGYEMILSIVNDRDEASVYRQLKAKGTVDGLIVHGPRINDKRIDLLREIGIPFLVHGRASGINSPYSWLDVNNRSAFNRATDFLLDLGHSRVALINGLEAMDFAYRRRDGYEQSLHARGIEPDPQLMRSDEMTEFYGYRSAREMMALDEPPTAYLVSSIIAAFGIRRAVEEDGLRIGRDISIITFDDALSYMKNGEDVPIFTAARSSVRDAGRQAGQMLLELIRKPEAGPLNTLLEAELMVGTSTGPVPRG